MLRVVRFRGVGMREHHELALCDEHDDGTTTVVYADRSWRGPSSELRHSCPVTEHTLATKATVQVTVMEQLDALERAVPERYKQVCACAYAIRAVPLTLSSFCGAPVLQ